MNTFQELNLSKALKNAIDDLGFEKPTPIQEEAFSVILSGKDMVGIAQTGTGKTFAYLLPLLQDFKFSNQINPRILIIVPTRELVLQVVENVKEITKYMSIRVLGVFGGSNIKTQAQSVAQGCDVLVATPGRLYDLALNRALQLKEIKKLVIDEVDVMLDLGFIFQLTNIFEILPERRQNIMFSATMTEEVDLLIDDFFIKPVKVSIALSGTPLDNIQQTCYKAANFYTKTNLLLYLLRDQSEFNKVLVFVSDKKSADRLHELLAEELGTIVGVIHSNKSQNYRIRMVEEFDSGLIRVLVTTDIMSRGLDLEKISHVINFDTPTYAENYMHRIGRSGRAEQEGKSILFYSPKEEEAKVAIENLMDYSIPEIIFPEEVTVSSQLTPEERPKIEEKYSRNLLKNAPDTGFHEKSEKNKKVNLGGSYRRDIAKKYTKPKTKGDKRANNRKKK